MLFSRPFWAIVVVACLNVTMNVCLKAASRANGVGASIRNLWFGGALLAGTAAIVLLLFVYRSDMSLARGVLLLGATSILVGVGVGTLLGDGLRLVEWLLFVGVLVFYVGSWTVRG